MRLDHLLAPWHLAPVGASEVEVTGIGHDSRRITPGDLYVAIVGARFDGRRFAADAVARGAIAILGPQVSEDMASDVASDKASDVAIAGVPWIAHEVPRRLIGPLAARLYQHPDRALTLAGITGTNGKSTTVDVLGGLLDAAGQPAGRLGTLGYRFAEHAFADAFRDGRTTPEAPDFYRTLRAMHDRGARAAVMEVSSHALDQGRVAGARFDVAVFTNLTRDHLDYHGDMESYFEAKRRLFEQLSVGGRGAINVDDPYGRRLAALVPDAVTYSAAGSTNADVHVREATLDLQGIRGKLATPRGSFPFATRLLGRYNLENVVASVAAAEVLGLCHESMARALAVQGPIDGRLEPLGAGEPFPILVDYAHTPAALEAALGALRELVAPEGRRIVVVFGCGGDRDQGKREPMGRIVGVLADQAIATSDNPRGEDPAAILAAVETGLRQSGTTSFALIPDRREAIAAAVQVAVNEPEEWAVLVAGKGHETNQIIGDTTLPFSDRDELRQVLATLGTGIQGEAGTKAAPGMEGAAHG